VLDRAWLDFLEELTELVRGQRLWNPTMAALARWVRSLALVSVIPQDDASVLLENGGSEVVEGFSLLLPPHTDPHAVDWNGRGAAGWRRNGDHLAVWGDLPAGAAALVRWHVARGAPESTQPAESGLREIP
jgi:hypothetical protein